MTIDHIIPKAKGGNNSITNMQLMCRKCNMKKGSKQSKMKVTGVWFKNSFKGDRGVVCGVKKWTAYVRKFDYQGDQDDCHQPKPLKEERL